MVLVNESSRRWNFFSRDQLLTFEPLSMAALLAGRLDGAIAALTARQFQAVLIENVDNVSKLTPDQIQAITP